jgi:hypothetical protein
MSRDSLKYSLRFYSEVRQRVSARFAVLSNEWPHEVAEKHIVFFGSGDIAEIGYVCLQETDLRLVAVIDDKPGKSRFFDMPVRQLDSLDEDGFLERPYWRLVVMSFDDVSEVESKLERSGIRQDRVCWL